MLFNFFKMKKFAEKLDFKIPQELQPYIVAAILGESDTVIHTTYPVHPTGFPLIIYVYSDIPILHINGNKVYPKSRLHLAGQIYNASCAIEIKGMFGQIGFVLYPTAPYYLFHKSGEYSLNKWKDFKETSPLNIETLYHTLENCKNVIERLDILIGFLQQLHLNRLPAIKWLDQSILEIYKSNGNISQEEIAEIANISLRHFRRRFKEVIGVPPKYFCKVVQLNTVFELLNGGDTDKLHYLALDCGYYDQAHFIKDFKKLIGESPNNFLTGKHAYVKTYLGRVGV